MISTDTQYIGQVLIPVHSSNKLAIWRGWVQGSSIDRVFHILQAITMLGPFTNNRSSHEKGAEKSKRFLTNSRWKATMPRLDLGGVLYVVMSATERREGREAVSISRCGAGV